MHEEFEFNAGRLRLCGQFGGAQMAGEHYTSKAGCDFALSKQMHKEFEFSNNISRGAQRAQLVSLQRRAVNQRAGVQFSSSGAQSAAPAVRQIQFCFV